MQGFGRLNNAVKSISDFKNRGLSNNPSISNKTSSLKRRSGFELAGTFLLFAVLAIFGANMRANHEANKAAAAKSQAAKIEIQQKAEAQPTVNEAPAQPQSDTSVSNSVTTTSTSNGVETEVTVNGQPVDVPNNGSVQKTVTSPNGTTTVTTSNSQSSNSNGFNSNFTNVHSSSSSNINQSVRVNEHRTGGQ